MERAHISWRGSDHSSRRNDSDRQRTPSIDNFRRPRPPSYSHRELVCDDDADHQRRWGGQTAYSDLAQTNDRTSSACGVPFERVSAWRRLHRYIGVCICRHRVSSCHLRCVSRCQRPTPPERFVRPLDRPHRVVKHRELLHFERGRSLGSLERGRQQTVRRQLSGTCKRVGCPHAPTVCEHRSVFQYVSRVKASLSRCPSVRTLCAAPAVPSL